MEIDIQYLLFLQNLRIATGGVFDEFFNSLSKFAVDVLPFLPYVIFWCVNKKLGYRFVFTTVCADILNGIIKLTVCAYRPWIRSDLIEPAGDSKKAATGYSFPSGHTVNATVNYGNVFVWQKGRNKWIAVLCAVLIALTAFSRNFLGVHTPQDVIVGFCEGVFMIWLIGKILGKADGNEKLLDRLTLAGFLLIVAVLFYVSYKPYPMDYVDGVLLVDPQEMMNDTFKACGAFAGILLGSFIERHYIHYDIPVHSENLPLLSCIGFAIIFSWKQWFAAATVVLALGSHWGNLLARFMMTFFAICLWPLVIRKGCKE